MSSPYKSRSLEKNSSQKKLSNNLSTLENPNVSPYRHQQPVNVTKLRKRNNHYINN